MPKIVGHRGAMGYEMENTLRSFQTAIDIGCDSTELDVHLSKDGVAMVIHDEELSRLTFSKGKIKNKTLSELKRIKLKDGQEIPTLEEVIQFVKGKIRLQIELKAPGTPEAVYTLLAKHKMVKDTLILSFYPSLLKEIKKLDPKIETCLLFHKYKKKLWKVAEETEADFIGPRAKAVTRPIVQKAHDLGMKVYAYHMNDKKTGEKLTAMGVDEIGTDYPKLFL